MRAIKITVNALAIALLALIAPAMPNAKELTPLPMSERAQWPAVGHLTGPGFRMKRGCSATLVAPKLIVTAAHCLTGAFGNPENQFFKAGLAGNDYVAQRSYRGADIHIHPEYKIKKGKNRLPFDVAVIKLSEPISSTEVTPIPIARSLDMAPSDATLLGYRHDKPNVLSGHDACRLLSSPKSEVYFYGCEVVSGISGGPVIVETVLGPELLAVIVARQDDSGRALTVPVNTWLRDKVSSLNSQ